MIALIKALHFLAVAFGSIASLGNIYLMLARGPHDLPDPGQTNRLRALYRLTGLGAIAVLWLTGLILLLAEYGGWPGGFAFATKLALVVALTAIILFVNVMAPGWARRGGPPPWTVTLQYIAAVMLVAIIVLAAFAFT